MYNFNRSIWVCATSRGLCQMRKKNKIGPKIFVKDRIFMPGWGVWFWVTRKTGNYLLTGRRRKLPENAGKHQKYIKILVAEVEGCNLDVYMEVMNDIEVPICRKKNGKMHHRVAVFGALLHRHSIKSRL